MKGLIQRVSSASVVVDGNCVGEIDHGILLLLGVEKEDDRSKADKLLDKVINYRIFSDESDKMNLSLKNIEGELLVVSQFTLVAETSKGKRPGFSKGASPALGEELYNYFVEAANKTGLKVATGKFGADMKVSLTNDGPVTFWLES
ncbi:MULTISPECIES: D-aminoacyl-tRNA deacylase [unclassified Marinobacterium]|jgi:D-aminoacyl-tRNA deacylase|uniref:D-aminoacyl-tRNA deacylase n=1 Tax=unclassified Marinobacterium TaxID=2644139 RepID=UPI0015695DB4|nr:MULTISPECIES: D-aminoacyl-tRNA deacylase [unclassified Marinobacterium]NRP16778.1 D-tyrosyl-tRNA(Tyr) deacylase [Marinobacterium sp. xm-a-152]NRP37341.1 D-tyrosyl-tRNA(Tyr) deacylase [Marinobacterium sp. xm-d-579]NRP38044.1 D-tyrosyl-tRNA(Tyr) deacylase [Marinobacterium sp. xm-a-121]NRP53801.1 D-tyrosyl-tRNA(Tyr) deacylase [Marinobacterium sp. xm-v-242]NRP58417.1 D-tyrosyl-tRNA(Tyr) deacylase [Marinobacterium sp. xm-d-510]